MEPDDAAPEGEAETDDSPFAAIIADATEGSRAQREMWLFLNSVPSATGFRVYAHAYELLSVGLVVFLLVEDMVLSVKEIGDVVNSWRITKWFEYLAYVIFTSEYLLRVWCCMASKKLNPGGSFKARLRSATLGRMKFGVDGLLLVDFVVLGAFYLQLYVDVCYSAKDGSKLQGLQVLRMFRAFRAFRSAKMLKVDRKSNSMGILMKVLESEATPILATLTIAFMLVIILATLMFYIENGAQPEAYSSIPAAMWWSVTALTSVGYGDVYPITVAGKILGCFACVVGAGIIALPTGILSNGFNEEICMAEEESEAERIEESVAETTKKLDTLCVEISALHMTLDEVDESQQLLIRGLRRLFPEKVLEVVGPEEEEPVDTFEVVCRCGNQFIHDAAFCRKCGSARMVEKAARRPKVGDSVIVLETDLTKKFLPSFIGKQFVVKTDLQNDTPYSLEGDGQLSFVHLRELDVELIQAPHPSSTKAPGSQASPELSAIRDKVERDVEALKKRRAHGAGARPARRGMFLRPGMTISVPSGTR